MSEETVAVPAVEVGAAPAAQPDPAGLFALATVPPPFLTQDYFQAALQDYENDKALQITSYAIGPATKPGDNFASVVFRATVSYKTRGLTKVEVPFIVKVDPFVDGVQKQMMGDGCQFETEIAMYNKTLPEMQRLLKSIGDDEILAPEFIFGSLKPKILILADIGPENFVPRKDGQNLEITQKVFLKLAKFHALSYYMNDNHEEVDAYREGFVSERMAASLAMMGQSFGLAAHVLRDWGKDFEVYADRITTLLPSLLPKVMKIYKANPPGQGFNVLNHGDFHVRNIMFNTDQTVRDADKLRFIDFQFCVWASPVIDIFWTLYFVGSTETRDNHREELIRLYYDEFVGTLGKLGYLKTPPSLLDLQIELLRNGVLELYAAIFALPMFFVDISKFMEAGPPSLEGMMAMGRTLMEEPVYKATITKLLPRLLHNGNMDV